MGTSKHPPITADDSPAFIFACKFDEDYNIKSIYGWKKGLIKANSPPRLL